MSPEGKAKAAGIYCRISDDRTGQAAGVQRQEVDCRDLAEGRRWQVAGVYVDNDLSAYKGTDRPEYRRLLEDIRGGSVDAVVVWHLDRLTRHPRELEEFFEVCDSAGLKNMASVSGDYDLSTGDGQFHARILGAVARKESDDKSRRIRRKHEDLAKQGRRSGGGTRGFGYEQDRVTIKEDEAALIRDAAKRIIAGESVRGICSQWNREGIATVTGTRWTPTVLKRILTAPGTAGLREHHGALYEGGWPGIIDRKTHERLKSILLDPARAKFNPGTARKYLLTGFAYCGLCDAKLVARPRADGARCYVCASGVGFQGCGKIRSLAEPLEEFVKEAILQRISSPRLTEALRQDDDSNDEDLLDSLREDELALEQLARDHYADKLISRSEFIAARAAIEGRMEQTKRELAGNGHSRLMLDLPNGTDAVRKVWDETGLDWRRSLLGAVIEKVIVNPAIRGRNRFDPDRIELQLR